MKCPECKTETKHSGTFSTLVGFSSPGNHDHDDNCRKRRYHCLNCHTKWTESKRNKCPLLLCFWKGKTECFCHQGKKVNKWSDPEDYRSYGCEKCRKKHLREPSDSIPDIPLRMVSTPIKSKPTVCPICEKKVEGVGSFVSRNRPEWLWNTYYPHKIWAFIHTKILGQKVGGFGHTECAESSKDWFAWKWETKMDAGFVYDPNIPDIENES